MAIKDVITAIRKEAGITQTEMARKLYVTRQAVSRWETGETEPGIDMIKLICVSFNVPLERFFEMPMEYYCQCCSMPIPDEEIHGREADGSVNASFCKYCYDHGDFTAKNVSMDDFIERTAPMEAEALGISREEAVSLMATLLPHLKRWKEVEANEAAYGSELRSRYGDEVMDAANEKYLAMGEHGHADASELEQAIKQQLTLAMEAGGPDGPQAAKLAEMHGRWLRMHWPEGVYTPQAHRSLAEGYLVDERFKKYYEQIAPGATAFLRDAIVRWVV